MGEDTSHECGGVITRNGSSPIGTAGMWFHVIAGMLLSLNLLYTSLIPGVSKLSFADFAGQMVFFWGICGFLAGPLYMVMAAGLLAHKAWAVWTALAYDLLVPGIALYFALTRTPWQISQVGLFMLPALPFLVTALYLAWRILKCRRIA
jgi:hypothetical protein